MQERSLQNTYPRNLYIEDLIVNLVLTMHKEHNKDLFNLLFNKTSRVNLPITNLDDSGDRIPEEILSITLLRKELKKH